MIKRFEFPEGATPISDCSGLIPTWVHHLDDLNRVEAENIMAAQRKYLRGTVADPKNWFNVFELKAIHRTMFSDVWEWAGSFRKSVTSIGIKPNLIPLQLAELCKEVLSWLENPVELTFLEMAARIHHRLVYIHPFENGNGRFSRIIADRFLIAFRCPHPIWPNHMNQDSLIRKEYIQTLKNADKGNYTPLIELMIQFGANNPTLSELIRNKFFRPYIQEKRGVFLIKAMIDSGGNPNDETSNGHRVLQLAIKAGLDEIVKTLIEFGAEIDYADITGLTPFQVAVIQGNKELADYILKMSAAK
jgi:Fic-DOC domain mobile mystery protein B